MRTTAKSLELRFWTDLPSWVGWSGLFFCIFLKIIFGGKNYPKNTEFSEKNLTFLAKPFFGKYSDLLSTFLQTRIENFVQNPADFTRFWQINKKILPKQGEETWVSWAVIQGFFFFLSPNVDISESYVNNKSLLHYYCHY